MIRGRCPICSKGFEVDRMEDLPSFPFCSERCRLIDLGRWIDEAYSIPASPLDLDAEDAEPPASPDRHEHDEDEDS